MAINVAHMTLSMEIGGIEKLIVNMAELINRKMFALTVGCLDSGGELLEEIWNMGFSSFVTQRRPGLDLRLIINLARIFARRKIDIVHAHNQATLFYAGLAAKLVGVPVVIVTEHSRHNSDKYIRRRVEKRILSSVTNKWVTVSNELAKLAVLKDKLPPSKIKVIQNGIDVERFKSPVKLDVASFKKELGFPKESKIIIMVSRLHPVKNHALLLDAFATIRKFTPDVHVAIVGDGECRTTLEEQTLKLNLQDRVHFLGRRKDIPELLKISDVFVLCSSTEGLPLSLLEACAAGLPVVITDKANRAGLIKKGETGIVTKATRTALANGLRIALKEEELCRGMANRARAQVIEKYSLEAMVKEYEKLYSELFSKSKRYRAKSVK